MNSIRGYLAAGIALIACPCHLIITLPLLLALTGGSAVGLWLAQNQGLVWPGWRPPVSLWAVWPWPLSG